MRHSLRAAFLAFTLAFPAFAEEATTPPPLYPVEQFAALARVNQLTVSPDGEFIAYISPLGGRQHVVMHRLGEKDFNKMVILPPIDEGRLTADVSWIRWANNERLFVSYRFTNDDAFRRYVRTAMFSVPREGKIKWVDMAQPSRDQRKQGYKASPAQFKDDIIDHLPDEPDFVLQSIDSDQDGSDEIRKVNVHTGKYSVVTEGRASIQNWLVDANHEPRLGWGYDQYSNSKTIYRSPETGKFIDLTDTEWLDSDRINPIGFTDDPRIVYALETVSDTVKRLVSFDVLEGKVKSILFEREGATATGLRRHPVNDVVIGYTYSDEDGGDTFYTDPFLNKLKARIDQLLPDGYNRIVDFVPARSQYFILHSNERNEGTYFILDLKSKTLTPEINRRDFAPDTMASTLSYTVAARDGLEFKAMLTLPVGRKAENLPLIVMPHGGPHARTSGGFQYQRQFFANRGYAVLEPDFRGSTGYGTQFKEAGFNEWGGKMQDDVTDATKWAIEKGIADPARICIVGGSYGGYASLMGTIMAPGMYACAISINGVADIPGMLRFDRYFLGGREWNKKIIPEGRKATDISPVDRAAEVSAPVLIIHAKDDPVVRFDQGKGMYSKLKSLGKPVEFIELKSGDHYLDTTEARLATLTAMEAFLKTHLGAPAP
ncbi:alpha/beta hydrolase family protein [Gimibacter soli]|uniref:S9 family peptidase n=1 Tax=Gimibacter soli TaxID=3024400 RepID=A0AAE9XS69_9PROT|nr:S9 family peptidase [Gimibacter soli]WCL54025.1 S9 family peptidase [Gimibacter soli]